MKAHLYILTLSLVFGLGNLSCSLSSSTTGSGDVASVSNVFNAKELSQATVAASKILVQRLPTDDEVARAQTGLAGYEQVIRSYLNDSQFTETMKNYHQAFFEMGGERNDINYNEPANLLTYIIINDLDFREAVLAKYCVNDNLEQIDCSTFTGNMGMIDTHAAGAITTQGFLEKWANDFNFRRVNKAFQAFSCSKYPDATDAGMTLSEINGEIVNFNKNSTADGTPNCYSCHRNLNARATTFYYYDEDGLFTTETDTTTDRSGGGRSRISDLIIEGSEPRYHEASITTVRDYAQTLVTTEHFRTCTFQRFYAFVFGKDHLEPLPEVIKSELPIVENSGFNAKEIIVSIMKHHLFIKR